MRDRNKGEEAYDIQQVERFKIRNMKIDITMKVEEGETSGL